MIFLIRRIIKSKEYSSHKCHKIRQTQAYEQRASVLSAEMGDYMNDKSLECIRFYDIQVNKMVKGRGGVILFTDRGCRLFLECSRNDGFYLRDEAVTKAVSDAGFENVDTYVRNQDGELFTVGDDGHRYVMKNWFGGRECDVKSVNDVMEAVRTLARLHICLNVVSSNGVRYLRNNVNTNITKQWECMALAETADEQPESELKASESIVHNALHFDRGAGLRTNMERHTKEIKKAANYMRGKKKKNEFEQIALGAVDTFFREADEASRNINSKRFDERFDRMEQTNELVHGSYNYHNVFLDVGNGGNAVTNFEKCHNDCQVADLYQFLRKVMEKHDWNINVAYRLVDARKYPLVFAHGVGQFSKTWETTPDGREGFQNIFLRKGFSTYLVDQPRRGNAGRSTEAVTLEPVFDEEEWFNRFRVGIYPDYFEGVQFSRDREALNQYFRQMTPTIGPLDFDVYSDAYAALFDKIGPAIFVTHSQGGPVGWFTLLKTKNIKAIVAYEPGGSVPFPTGQVPEEGKVLTRSKKTEGIEVPMAVFKRYMEIPIIIYYGDNLPETDEHPELYEWTRRLHLMRKWAEMLNKLGGDVTVIHLPDVGLHGNTHFPMSDLNNVEVADLLSKWLYEKQLDR